MNSFPSLATDGGVGSASAAHSNSDAIYYSDPQVLAAVQEAKARATLVKRQKAAKVSLTSVSTSKDEQPAHQEHGDDSAPHSFKRFAPPPNMMSFFGDVGPTVTVVQPQAATSLLANSPASSLASDSASSMLTSVSSDNSQILASLDKILQYQQAFSKTLESHDSKLENLEQRINHLGGTTTTSKKKSGKRASGGFFPHSLQAKGDNKDETKDEDQSYQCIINKKSVSLKYLKPGGGLEYGHLLGDLSIIYTMQGGKAAVKTWGSKKYLDYLPRILNVLPVVCITCFHDKPPTHNIWYFF